jgi:hypothetical protein
LALGQLDIPLQFTLLARNLSQLFSKVLLLQVAR